MEAIWNVNSTPISDFFAIAAIRQLKMSLPKVLAAPRSLEDRRDMQIAALSAGLAMATTQTALAHSISYSLTARLGVPHGFASAITLGAVAKYNSETNAERVALVADAFDSEVGDLSDQIYQWMTALHLPEYLRSYALSKSTDWSGEDLINPTRASNNIRPVDSSIAREILRDSLRALFN
jgi:alcohol dehydrogenase class IV